MPQYEDTVQTVYRVDEGADLHINMNARANPDNIIYKWINQRVSRIIYIFLNILKKNIING